MRQRVNLKPKNASSLLLINLHFLHQKNLESMKDLELAEIFFHSHSRNNFFSRKLFWLKSFLIAQEFSENYENILGNSENSRNEYFVLDRKCTFPSSLYSNCVSDGFSYSNCVSDNR